MNKFFLTSAALFSLLMIGCGGSSDSSSPSSSTGRRFSTFQAASLVLGQSDFISANDPGTTYSSTSLKYPVGIAAGSSSLYIADQAGNRVVGYSSLPSSNGAAAQFAVGQGSLTTNTSGNGAGQFAGASAVFVHGTKLLVADESNNKIMIWNSLPTSNANADVVIGHNNVAGIGGGSCADDQINSPNGIFVTPAGKVIVANTGHNRIHIWNNIDTLATGDAADIVLGDSICNSGVTADKMDWPTGVWSDDTKLVVVDTNNSRVLIWNTFPTTNHAPANVVLGQTQMDTNTTGATRNKMQFPWGLTSDGTKLFVSEPFNHRVLIWNSIPTTNGADADVVLGQGSFTGKDENDDDQDGSSDGPPTARTLNFPAHIHYRDGKLYVTDRGNFRVLIFTEN